MADDLTPREIECVQLAGARLRNGEIATRLGIAEKTVANTLQSAFRKLGTNNRITAGQRLGIRYPGLRLPDDLIGSVALPPPADAEPSGAKDLAGWYRPPPRHAGFRVIAVFVGTMLAALLALGISGAVWGALEIHRSTVPEELR